MICVSPAAAAVSVDKATSTYDGTKFAIRFPAFRWFCAHINARHRVPKDDHRHTHAALICARSSCVVSLRVRRRFAVCGSLLGEANLSNSSSTLWYCLLIDEKLAMCPPLCSKTKNPLLNETSPLPFCATIQLRPLFGGIENARNQMQTRRRRDDDDASDADRTLHCGAPNPFFSGLFVAHLTHTHTRERKWPDE